MRHDYQKIHQTVDFLRLNLAPPSSDVAGPKDQVLRGILPVAHRLMEGSLYNLCQRPRLAGARCWVICTLGLLTLSTPYALA